MKCLNILLIPLMLSFMTSCKKTVSPLRENFGSEWRFHLGDDSLASSSGYDDSAWRVLDIPHDWSIEGEFSETNPATPGGGALPGGIGWYRKTFRLNQADSGKIIFVDFDGVYMKSSVWINGHLLGTRPNGYISFRYDLTPFLRYGENENILAVKVDNSKQPNSRWYSGSGIYRNVWLVKKEKVYIPQWGTYITTPKVTEEEALINISVKLINASDEDKTVSMITNLMGPGGSKVGSVSGDTLIKAGKQIELHKKIRILQPALWSIQTPSLYQAVTQVKEDHAVLDEYRTNFGIRYFNFDVDKGFSLNGIPTKINGVCNHHDLGCLGTAVNTRALERQLEILQEMGCNAIRTSHNPPAPELLELCDRMGFIVMDEMFDMWKKNKTPYDFGLYWDEWHVRDLTDFMLRDRNHPSVIIWSIGNEIPEQWDTSGVQMVKDLYELAKSVDSTRPVTTANNPPGPWNNLTKPMVLDLIGYNYAQNQYVKFPENFPGQKFIATETASALATRGHYDMPSDSIRRWPYRWDIPFTDGNPDNTVSAYDNVSAPWGSTHEETWRIIKKYDYLSGMFVWTGFDYLGEPTPYGWPSRSSYFGIIDLAGFPKDSYYMYKSEWTEEPVLHLFPHWNWEIGDTVDVWAYFNCEEVELFLNGESMGTKRKAEDVMHVFWRLPFSPGTLRAEGRTDGEVILTREIHTAGEPARIEAYADRSILSADGKDLSFITIDILDSAGNQVPQAENLVRFKVEGKAKIAGVDNGSQTSHESFKADHRKAFNGKCLVVLQAGTETGEVVLTASSDGLEPAKVNLSLE